MGFDEGLEKMSDLGLKALKTRIENVLVKRKGRIPANIIQELKEAKKPCNEIYRVPVHLEIDAECVVEMDFSDAVMSRFVIKDIECKTLLAPARKAFVKELNSYLHDMGKAETEISKEKNVVAKIKELSDIYKKYRKKLLGVCKTYKLDYEDIDGSLN